MTPLSTGIRRASLRRTPRPRGRPGRSILAAGLVLGGLAATGAPLTASAQVDDRPVAAAEPPPFEVLTLGCGVRQTDQTAAVRCRWSAPTLDAAAGLRLWRITVGADQGRQIVFRTDDVSVTSHTDAPVRPGHRYVYVIQAVNETGRTVGLSRGAAVGVPPTPDVRPDIEALRLHCRPGDDFRVGCAWTAPTVNGARTLTLWRSVDGGARERVLSSHHPFPTAYRDTVPDGTSRVAYAVIATDSDGEIVARSRAAWVTFRDVAPTDVAPTDVARRVPMSRRPMSRRPMSRRPMSRRPMSRRPMSRPS